MVDVLSEFSVTLRVFLLYPYGQIGTTHDIIVEFTILSVSVAASDDGNMIAVGIRGTYDNIVCIFQFDSGDYQKGSCSTYELFFEGV